MLFRLLIVIAVIYLLRPVISRFLAPRVRDRAAGRREEPTGLDLSRYDVEDAEYRDLDG
jgi:hypothetical protein